ncbi:MAG: tRNA (N6-threonylcarbamoyladenosine(37)-N6)-methyltransferase TrmO [Candidatus Hydrogenedentes bacterium]|nr:tRNA (N6-threonylcarbamoyladenosine(37)-N6)-methyltransferase TrmO [Candidatus Hydrogenedentota bacterium]
MILDPIGIFHCAAKYPYDAARQGSLAPDKRGTVELHPGHNYEQALQGIEGFSHLWLLFQFHQNAHWKPLVQPPRGHTKIGVFASRAPYRPNPIGISCVRLLAVSGRRLDVAGHDLLDATPILDIKPYLPYADAFPEATPGWTGPLKGASWQVLLSEMAREQCGWLREQGLECLEDFALQQLSADPLETARKRVRPRGGDRWTLAYRTWRIRFTAAHEEKTILVESIGSGYSPGERDDPDDHYKDKAVHRAFVARYPTDDETP